MLVPSGYKNDSLYYQVPKQDISIDQRKVYTVQPRENEGENEANTTFEIPPNEGNNEAMVKNLKHFTKSNVNFIL